MTKHRIRNHHCGRRTALRTAAGALSFGIGLGAITTAAAAEQSNYAEIDFEDQRTGGATVRVARTLVEADGFITIHTWDLLNPPEGRGDGPGTIVGVSRLLEPGVHYNESVKLFHDGTGFSPAFEGLRRLQQDQKLIAVPHRDMDHTGTFDFTGSQHTDIPFTNGPTTRDDLPVEDAVNDVASITVGRPDTIQASRR